MGAALGTADVSGGLASGFGVDGTSSAVSEVYVVHTNEAPLVIADAQMTRVERGSAPTAGDSLPSLVKLGVVVGNCDSVPASRAGVALVGASDGL